MPSKKSYKDRKGPNSDQNGSNGNEKIAKGQKGSPGPVGLVQSGVNLVIQGARMIGLMPAENISNESSDSEFDSNPIQNSVTNEQRETDDSRSSSTYNLRNRKRNASDRAESSETEKRYCDPPEMAKPDVTKPTEEMDTGPDVKPTVSNGRPVRTSDQDDQNASNQKKSGSNSEHPDNDRPKSSGIPETSKTLTSYEHRHEDDDVQVTFEVMLSDGLYFPNLKVRMAFGPPLSDWQAGMVEMKIKDGTPEKITPGNYVYLTGVLPMNRNFLNKNIPYKYIVVKSSGDLAWEHIDVAYAQKVMNRCLLVPGNVNLKFSKFDDVILADWPDKSRIRCLQRWGREAATKWMLPRPSELDNPDFDLQTAIQRFKMVTHAHGFNGTKLCIGNDRSGHCLNPIDYDVQKEVGKYLENFLQLFTGYLSCNDIGKLLRTALYFCLLGKTSFLEIREYDHFLGLFEAFRLSQNLLFEKNQLPKSIVGEIQLELVAALKKLVRDFVGLRNYQCRDQPVQTRGNWIYVLPFIHLWDSTEENFEEWLRLKDWKNDVQYTNYSSLHYLEYVSVMKAMDPKLDQVFMATLEHQEMEKIITEDDQNILLFSPTQLLEMLGDILERSNKFEKACSKVSKRFHDEFEDMTKQNSPLNDQDRLQLEKWKDRMRKYLSINCSRAKKYALFNLLLDIISDCQPIFDMSDLVPDLAQRMSTDLSNGGNLSDICKGWSECLPKLEYLNGEIQLQLLNRFLLHLVNVSPEVCFEVFLEKANVLSKDISDIVFKRGILVLNEKKEPHFFKGLLKKGKELLGIANDSRSQNLTQAFNECIGKLKCYQLVCPEVFKSVTDHTSISNFMKFFPKLQELKLLSYKVEEDAKWILKQITEFLERLDEGKLTLDTIGLLTDSERVERLLSLHECIQEMKAEAGFANSIKTMIAIRLQERNEFFNAKQELNMFKLKFDKNRRTKVQLDKLMNQFSVDTSVYFLKAVCEMRSVSRLRVVLKLHLITPEHREVVSRHNKLFNKSSVFRQIHETFVTDSERRNEEDLVDEEEGDLDDDDTEDEAFWEEVVGSAEEMFVQFEDFVDRLSRLETPIAEVDRRFQAIHQNGKLHEELLLMEESVQLTGVVKKVEETINRLFTINQHKLAAEAVREAAEILGRETSFPVVEKILRVTGGNSEFESQPLSIINEELIKAGETFESWNNEHIKALTCFRKSKNILKFLKENIKDRVGLKTFYELATISAGESDLEVDRVSHFYQSVNSYAPLILDLKIKTCSFVDFLNACRSVFAAMKSDPAISQKLIESSNRNLEWIKACKDQQGSVEQSSLTLVSKINLTGVYTVAAPKSRSARQSNSLTMDNCIQMTYQKVSSENEEDVLVKELPLEELQELRSKLMLITAGTNGQKDVDRFVRILGLVELVAKHFIALISAGCHLFSQWKLQVICDESKKVKLFSDFGLSSGILLRGENDVEFELERVSEFLKSTLDDWSNHVFELRDNFPSLNFFTTDQLVLLSAQFARLVYSNSALSHQAIILLNLISPDSNPKQLSSFVKASILHERSDEDERMAYDSDDDSESEHSVEEDGESSEHFQELKSGTIFKELSEYFNEDLALAALLVCGGAADLDTLTAWCYDHSDENFDDIINRFKGAASKYQGQAEDEENEPNLPNSFKLLFDEKADGLLSDHLENIWQQFLVRVNSLQITNHISFEALAQCLEELSTENGMKPLRTFPPTFTAGEKNLVVCSESEILSMALSCYMLDPEKRPPSLDECLICQNDTPREQIELICRRAFTDRSGKIFVIVHAERMNYDTGMYIENLVNKTTVSNASYRLVFIACKEVNDLSYIVTAFDKCRQQMPALPHKNDFRQYLLNHLQHRSSADPDRSVVRVVKSRQSGNGKSLVAQRLSEKNRIGKRKIIQLHDSEVDFGAIISTWLQERGKSNIFHLDVTPAVTGKRADLVFSLSVLGGISDSSGHVWLNAKDEYYIIELTTLSSQTTEKQDINNPGRAAAPIPFEDYVPSILCLAPEETAEKLKENPDLQNEFLPGDKVGTWIYLFDFQKFKSEVFQRPHLYLSLMKDLNRSGLLDLCTYDQPKDLTFLLDCLETLLENCSIGHPTWIELTHFASFLNAQLASSEKSIFCNADLMREDFPGMKTFVINFLISMAKDFATRSVEISDQSRRGDGFSKPEMRQRWENSPHPYIFFNEDGHSMSFYGFRIDPNLNLIDERTNQILVQNIMTRALYDGLARNRVVFNKLFDQKSEAEKIADLCTVLGVETQIIQSPDKSYELTSDNVMKMLAIHMRFRSNIPVVIMGETGSGKTRLVKFMCDLLRGNQKVQNLLIMKTHGGITKENIYDMVLKAIIQAQINTRKGVKQTVLFFDEANTTNAIGTFKEVMCDRLLNGQPIPENIGLQFIAAVNPYREHSAEMIKKLENAGLGYHIKSDKTKDKLGKIPMRRLVYRVREIPASMFPLIWDFGTLDTDTEKKYIVQMVANRQLDQRFKNQLLEVLCQSQQFMRERKDECSFVSLRDVERMLSTLEWFQSQSRILLPKLYEIVLPNTARHLVTDFTINLILALGVSYFVRLDEQRRKYEDKMTNCLGLDPQFFSKVILACQDIFIDELRLEPNIAKNDALKENVWMMAICIERKIPLFLVGKPGSSKSLAKTVITDVMQGDMSYSSDLFRHFKEIHMVSFQCSPLATAGGILSTFRQCQKFQEKRDLNKFAAVCVLDEVGLAEDSPKMPLKALHPLLEDGCVDAEEPLPHKKVSFIGISNWALDPAKMNRGILLSRGVPTEKDLIKSAEGICSGSNNNDVLSLMKPFIKLLATGYYKVYKEQEREYFGLRDFYSLVKMVNAKVARTGRVPEQLDIVYAVQRNFGGYFGDFKPANVFLRSIYPNVVEDHFMPPKSLIAEAIRQEGETRYVLLLTKNNAALNIVQEQNLLNLANTKIIFGSSFADDQEYRQICRNINQIKIAMETGLTVVLCNLNNLYESLYDALNQNYTTMSDVRYVDLGLGTHRVKCRIHPNFRLVLIAEDIDVYEKFPIPLINRLEKHFLGMETMLAEDNQKQAVEELKTWLEKSSKVDLPLYMAAQFQQFSPSDVFIGYHNDAPASIVLRLGTESGTESIVDKAKSIFLECATPDAISRLSETRLSSDEKKKVSEVFYELRKNSISEAIQSYSSQHPLIQVTTFSRLLTDGGKKNVCRELNKKSDDIQMLTLQQINTEEQFSKRIHTFLEMCKGAKGQKILIVQAQVNPDTLHNLVECTRYSILNQVQQYSNICHRFCILLVLQVPRVRGGFFAGFPGTQWKALHIDELCGDPNNMVMADWNDMTLTEVLKSGDQSLLKKLLPECIAKSASTAYQSEDLTSSRIVQCVEIIKNCIDDDEEFVSGLCFKLLDLIANENSQNPEKWMSNLAVGSIHLKEGNTFARSIWLHLVDKVCVHLSKIISTFDLFSGLDHLVDRKSVWIRDLYIRMMASVQLNENPACKMTFSSKFPFSWSVDNQLEKLHRKVEREFLTEAFKSTEIGSIVNQIFDAEPQASLNFLCDVVQIKIGCKVGDSTLNLLCEQVYRIAKTWKAKSIRESFVRSDTGEVGDLNFNNMDLSAPDIYSTVDQLKPRLQLTVSLVNLIPALSGKLDPSASGDHFNHDDHFNLDLRAVQAAFDELVPNGADMLDEQLRSRWTFKIATLCTYFRQIEALLNKDDISEENQRLISLAQKKCARAEIVKIYFGHVLQKDVDIRVKEIVAKSLKFFWIGLDNVDFVTSTKTFDSIVLNIKNGCRNAGEVFLDQKNQECLICRESLRLPVALPCGHVGCKTCLKSHFETGATRVCPEEGCRQELPENFAFQSSVDMEKAVKHHADFRQKTSQFFIEFLQSFVFRNDVAPHPDIVNKLLSFVVTKQLPKDKLKPRTKVISPFDGDYIDPSPVIRSFLLQLLFRYTKSIEVNLQKFMDEKEPFVENGRQFPELCLMIVQCLEDSFLSDERNISGSSKIRSALQHMNNHLEKGDPDNLVKALCHTALDRLAINTVANSIISFLSGELKDDREASIFFKTAINFVNNHSQSQNLKKYIVRFIAAKHQVGAVVEWKKKGVCLDLLPEDLRNSANNEAPDMFLIIDCDYKNIRDALRLAWLSSDYGVLNALLDHSKDKPVVWSLAIHHLNKLSQTKIKDPSAFGAFLTQHPWMSNIWDKNQEPIYQNLVGKGHRRESIYNLLIHFKETIFRTALPQFLNIFRELATNSRNCALLFLPTMPHDETLETKTAVGANLRWYSCSKGHFYAIGECGRPTQQSICPDCNEPIGGLNHAFVRNVQPVQPPTDQTRPGHVLGEARVGTRSVTVRETGGLEVAVIRFLLHSSMYHECQTQPLDVLSIITPRLPAVDAVEEFVANHLLLNLKQISDCLGKSENDAIVLLHQVISRLGKVRCIGGDWRLDQKAKVKTWEVEFVKQYIKPAHGCLENDIVRQRTAVSDDKEEAATVLNEIIYEKSAATVDRSKVLDLPQFWMPRENIRVEGIESKIGSKRLKDHCPFLLKILQKENIFRELAQLPKLIELARFVTKNYSRQLEVRDTDAMTVKRFVSNMDPNDRRHVLPLIDTFLATLNNLKTQLFASDKVGRKLESLLGGLSISSKISSSVLFPASHGFGLAFNFLIHFLIDHHNSIVKDYSESNNLQLTTVGCQEIIDRSMLVSVEGHDLHLAIVANSEFEIGLGDSAGNAKWILKEVSLEQQIIDRFLSGKPMIDTKTIPRFEYRLDNLSFQGWEDLDSKIRQFKSLPSKSVADHLESELPMIRDVSSVLEILQVTANTIALLDPQSVKSEDSLLETIRRLKIVPQSDSKVLPKSLGQLKLGHLVPVMIQLRFVRAKRMVCNNQPPFHKSAEPFHEQLPQHMLPSIDKLLHRVQPELIALELLDFINDCIEAKGDSIEKELSDKTMSDYFRAFLESKESIDVVVDDLVDHLDSEIKMKHAISLFCIIAKKIQEKN